MLDYSKNPCVFCGECTIIYHQYIGDSCCESCGKWQNDDDEQTTDKQTKERSYE